MTIEPTMRAALLREHGDVDAIRIESVPVPNPGPGEVRIEVRASTLNWLDVAIRRGPKFGAIPLPIIGGADIAGVVEAVGDGVDDWATGDEVLVYPLVGCGHCAACRQGEPAVCPEHRIFGEHLNGGMAEYTIVPASTLLDKPRALTFAEAAALPVVFMTAWHMLITRAGLRAGETILILGAGGGVASAGIQIANLAGARVLTTTSTSDKTVKAKELGAEEVFNYRDPGWVQSVLDATSGRGVDIVQDNVGALSWPDALASLARNGRLVSTGSHSGSEVTFDLSRIYHRQLQIIGANGGTYEELATALRLVEQGYLKPVVDSVLPLDEIREGHRRLEKHEHFGKIVIEPPS